MTNVAMVIRQEKQNKTIDRMFRSQSAGSLLSNSSATQTRFIQNRVKNVEKYYGEICSALAGYTRKIAGQRDKGDELSQILQNYAATENVSKNSSKSIIDFSDSIAFVSDYRDACVHRIEETIIHEMSMYSEVCKSAMEDIKNCQAVQQKEIAQQKYINRLRQQNPFGRMQITKAESDLQQAMTQSMRISKAMEDKIDQLEKKKNEDFNKWMKRLLLIEISFHSSSLSVLSKAFQQLNQVDIDSDLEEFRNVSRLCGPLDNETSPTRAQSVPTIALPNTPNEKDKSTPSSKIKRSKSLSDYRQRAESLDSLKVEEYEELNDVEGSDQDDFDTSEEDEPIWTPKKKSIIKY